MVKGIDESKSNLLIFKYKTDNQSAFNNNNQLNFSYFTTNQGKSELVKASDSNVEIYHGRCLEKLKEKKLKNIPTIDDTFDLEESIADMISQLDSNSRHTRILENLQQMDQELNAFNNTIDQLI